MIYRPSRGKPPVGVRAGGPLARDLIAAYVFGEQGALRFTDSCRQRFGITVPALTGWTQGPNGGGVPWFDGTNFATYSGTINPNNGQRSITMACWYKMPSSNVKGLMIGDIDGNRGIGFGVGSGTLDTAGSTLIAIAENVAWIDSGVTIPVGWNHIALTVNASGTPQFYLNAVAVNTPSGAPRNDGPTTEFHVGGYFGLSLYHREVTGPIDEAYYWGRVLTQAEISILYRQPFAMYARPPRRQWVGNAVAATVPVQPIDMVGGMGHGIGMGGGFSMRGASEWRA